ncbi:MAG: SdpI family protein [Saprospiraceae bacterium]|nr:SdpI family protein [Saprospiraceae bacterium]
MNNWENPLFLLPFLVGLTFVVVAFISKTYPPRGINKIYGYRTKRSMNSQAQWDFAQEYSNNLMNRYGIMLIILGIAGYFTSFSNTVAVILGGFIITFFITAMIFKTERALKNNFDD